MSQQQGSQGETKDRWIKRHQKWLVPVLCATFAIHFGVAPFFGLREEINERPEKLWISVSDKPPLHLVFEVVDGRPQSEYKPSFSYYLITEQELRFKNPILWRRPAKYEAPREGSVLTHISQRENIRCFRKEDNTAVTLWPTTRWSFKETSSVKLTWKLSGCDDHGVELQTSKEMDTLRVRVWNSYEYPVRYLGMIRLPLMSNTIYTIKTEDSPQEFTTSKSVVVRCDRCTVSSYEVELPIIVEIAEGTVLTFDIQISHEPPKILLWGPEAQPGMQLLPTGEWAAFLGSPTSFGSEVAVLEIEGRDKVVVVIEPTLLTEPEVPYRVTLYADDELFAVEDILWDEYQLEQGLKKSIVFKGVPLDEMSHLLLDITPE